MYLYNYFLLIIYFYMYLFVYFTIIIYKSYLYKFMNKNIYNQVCSFGPFCHTGNLLQRLRIKIVSFPFDWCCSNPLYQAQRFFVLI